MSPLAVQVGVAVDEKPKKDTKPKYPNITDRSIDPRPEAQSQNQVLRMEKGIPVRNWGYSPGSEVKLRAPGIRFATKPVTDNSEGVVNWFVQALDQDDNPIGTGTVSTRIVHSSTFISKKTKDGKSYRLTVFRPAHIVY